MNRRQTAEVFGSILDSYGENPTDRNRYLAGAFMPAIDETRGKVRAAWEVEFGQAPPDCIVRREYVWSDEDRQAVSDYTTAVEAHGTLQQREEYANLSGRDLRGQISVRAHRISEQLYQRELGFYAAQPDLTLTHPVTEVPELKSESRLIGGVHTNIECATTVFGMTAMHVLGENGFPAEEFDSQAAFDTIDRHPAAPRGAVFDLPWMMNTLAAPYVEAQSGATVRSIVTIGADFGEIQDRIIEPVAAKVPGIEFGISVALASRTAAKANHYVAVIEADGLGVTVRDPRMGTEVLPRQVFWNRWAPTNMQAVVTVTRPTSDA